MPIGQIPPWLNVQPEQFQRAYEAGAHTGLQLADLRERRASQERAQQLQLQEMAARAAERQATSEEHQREFQERLGLDKERLATQERLSSERDKHLDEYRDAQVQARESGLNLQRANLGLAKERAMTAAAAGDRRAQESLLRLGTMMRNLDLAQERFKETERHNKATEEGRGASKGPTMTVSEMSPEGTRVSRHGSVSEMEQYLPKPAPEPPPEEPSGPGILGRARDFMFRPPIGQGPVSPDVLGPTLDLRSTNSVPTQEEGVRVRRKSDGKTFRYRGEPADVPLDTYDIVQ